MPSKLRHILALSGGKDSTALAIHLRDRIPELEYVFCDTRKELPETYDYLHKIEAYLGKPIVHLWDERGFDHWLVVFRDCLPSTQMRWCTKLLKIKPFEKYVGEDDVRMYVGIRADEDRAAYISSKPNIKAVYPFKEDGIDLAGVQRILEESGLGYPDYYNWRSRSGCYFCFFQRRNEWLGLKEKHPDLFELAKAYEKSEEGSGYSYTWNQRESLIQLEQPERTAQIRAQHEKALEAETKRQPNRPLADILDEVYADESTEEPCFFCHS
jgi:3'-phosphoadenosine 5'-phosphosulfate sulfotransferase (PAPS reductase)/FAD synthetase